MKKQTGMTLIELMIVTIILVILSTVGVPLMKSFIDNNNLKAFKSTFEKTLTQARAEAVQRGQIVRITPISSSDPDSPNDWSKGWSIHLVDPVTNTLELIRTFDSPGQELVFTSDDFGSTTPLEFKPTGQANQSGSFTMNQKDCSGGKRFMFTMLLSGSINRGIVTCN